MGREKKTRPVGNARCVIVMTNLAFAPDGSQKEGHQHLGFRCSIKIKDCFEVN